MTGALSLLAAAILATLLVWLVGGALLRIGGALLTIGGLLLTAATGSPAAALLAAVGALAWLGGHWLFSARHHYYASPLARRIFEHAPPPALNEARRWGIRISAAERR